MVFYPYHSLLRWLPLLPGCIGNHSIINDSFLINLYITFLLIHLFRQSDSWRIRKRNTQHLCRWCFFRHRSWGTLHWLLRIHIVRWTRVVRIWALIVSRRRMLIRNTLGIDDSSWRTSSSRLNNCLDTESERWWTYWLRRHDWSWGYL